MEWNFGLSIGLKPDQLPLTTGSNLLWGRVIEVHKDRYKVLTERGLASAQLSGQLRHRSAEKAELPTVGDFVALREHGLDLADHLFQVEKLLLPRRSQFGRQGEGGEVQLIAANVDLVFIVTSLNQDFNLRRLERYLLAAWDSGATPMIVLSKADLSPDPTDAIAAVEAIAMGAAVIPVSAATGEGMDQIRAALRGAKTGVFVGSSGVGKSTLVNALLETDCLATQGVRAADDRGRHTTTYRSLWQLPAEAGGGMIIDTPGMRLFSPAVDDDIRSDGFSEVEEWIGQCGFRDCRHGNEPDCRIQEALRDGTLEPGRWRSYQKLTRESQMRQRRADHNLARSLKRQKTGTLRMERWRWSGKNREE